MTGGAGLPAGTTPTSPQGSPAEVGYLLPQPIWDHFRRTRGGLGTLLAKDHPRSIQVACWMAATGWTKEAAVRAVQDRDGKCDWADRAEVGDFLAMGRYLVFGSTPSYGTVMTHYAMTKGLRVTGLPRLDSEDLEDYLTAVRVIHAHGCQGRASQTERHVLEACCFIAQQAGTIRPDLSGRRIAALVNYERKPVDAALRRLAANGFLHQAGRRSRLEACPYLIRAQVPNQLHIPSRVHEMWRHNGTMVLAHPAFHAKALGKTCFDLLNALRVGPHDDTEWQALSSASRSAFYRAKPYLTGGAGINPPLPTLAGRFGDSWVMLPMDRLMPRLDDIARQYGTDDRVARKLDRFQREREGFAVDALAPVAGRYEVIDASKVVDTSTGEIMRPAEVHRRETAIARLDQQKQGVASVIDLRSRTKAAPATETTEVSA